MNIIQMLVRGGSPKVVRCSPSMVGMVPHSECCVALKRFSALGEGTKGSLIGSKGALATSKLGTSSSHMIVVGSIILVEVLIPQTSHYLEQNSTEPLCDSVLTSASTPSSSCCIIITCPAPGTCPDMPMIAINACKLCCVMLLIQH